MLPSRVDAPVGSPASCGMHGGWGNCVTDADIMNSENQTVGGALLQPPDVHVGNVEAGLSSSPVLRLVEDYPYPLTAEQRDALYRHTAVAVRRFHAVRRGANTVERGYNSLKSLLLRLEGQRSLLQASLDELNSKIAKCGTSNEAEAGETTSPAEVASEKEQTAVITKEASGRGRPRGGGLLRSAMFANLHNVLTAAKRERNQEQCLSITLERDRIGKMTQLKIIEDDMEQQKKHFSVIEERYEKIRAFLESTKEDVLEALRLFSDVQRMETTYASRFFLRAAGLRGDGGSSNDTSTASFDIFFTPAKYTEEVEDIIREQIEETLDEYLSYRRRVDPVLELIAERRRQRDVERAGRLLQLIGVDANSTSVDVGSGVIGGSSVLTDTVSVGAATENVKERQTTAGHISDESDDEFGDGEGDEDVSAELQEKRQRDQIQSALAALDDFEELY